MAKTLTLRLSDNDSKLIEEIKELTLCSVSSKALLVSARMAINLFRDNENKEHQISILRNEVERLNFIIDSAREAGLKLYEATSQSDIFGDSTDD